MKRRQLLFVTYRDDHLDEGLSYAIELAKAMDEDIELLLVQKKETIRDKLDTMMAAVSFAEAGEHDTAREIMAGGNGKDPSEYEKKLAGLVERCGKEGMHLGVQNTDADVISGIRAFIRKNPGIDKVVLSPTVTESEVLTTKELTRLVRTASRPVVTMTRQSSRALKELSVRASEPEFAHH